MNTAVTSLPLAPAGDASASAATGLRRFFGQVSNSLWKALEAAGQARAQRYLLDLADRCEALQPDLAKELRAATRQGSMV